MVESPVAVAAAMDRTEMVDSPVAAAMESDDNDEVDSPVAAVAFQMKRTQIRGEAAESPRRATEVALTLPPFDGSCAGTPARWNRAEIVVVNKKTRKSLPEGSPAVSAALISSFLRGFFRTRSASSGDDLTCRFDEPEHAGESWWRVPFLGLSGEPPSEPDQHWLRGWHGCKLEALYAIVNQARLRASSDASRGDRFFDARPGVYLHKDALAAKCENYIHYIPLTGDGLLWAAKWELRCNPEGSVKAGKRTDQVIMAESHVRLAALWLSVHTRESIPPSSHVQLLWDPLSEAQPDEPV